MKQSILFASTLAALAAAFPAEHARGHAHHRREAVNYDTSKVDWSKLDWDSIFGRKAAAPAPAAPAPAPAPAAPAPVAAAPAPVAAVAKAAAPVVAAAAPVAAAVKAAVAPVTNAVAASVPSGGKRGIAWDQANDVALFPVVDTGKTSFYWNWGLQSNIKTSKTFLPMAKTIGDFADAAAGQHDVLLGPNEPDHMGVSPGAVAAAYKQYLTPARASGQIKYLTGPAITNSQSGLSWLKEFMAACSDCKIDALQTHWYGPSMDMFYSQLSEIHSAFPSLPVWILEIGFTNWNQATNPSADQVAAMQQEALGWLESTSWVGKYAFFMAGQIDDQNLGSVNALLNGRTAGSSLSSFGAKYVN